MVLFVLGKESFEDKNPGVEAEEIGLDSHILLGREVYTAVWDEVVDRDDLAIGKQALAYNVEKLRKRLKLVQDEGIDGIYISHQGVIYQQADLERDINRMCLDPEYEDSRKALDAVNWFKQTADVIQL